MLLLKISNQVVGRTWLYEGLGQTGRKKLVPIYKSTAQSPKATRRYIFAVTRDSSCLIFSETTERFATGGECPPSKSGELYQGCIHHSNNLAFALRLYEPWCDKHISLKGSETTIRQGILIHHGPARSEGCFTVAGGRVGFKRFRCAIEELIETPESIRILVEPR